MGDILRLAKQLGVSDRSVRRWQDKGGDIESIAKDFNKTDWLSISQAASYLGVSQSTVYRWATQEDVLEVVRLNGKMFRVSKRSVRKLLEVVLE